MKKVVDKKIAESELVDSVYELAADPHQFDAFTSQWDKYLDDIGAEDGASSDVEALYQHFERTFRIFEKMGRQSPAASNIHKEIKTRVSPCVLIDSNGVLAFSNEEASKLGFVSDKTQALAKYLHESSRATLVDAIARATHSPGSLPVVVLLTNDMPCLLVLSRVSGSSSIMVDISGSSWSYRISDQLASAYALTVRECEIASFLYKGLSLGEIASLEGKSVETLRKQMKSILYKTGCSSQSQLMRVLTGLSFTDKPEDSHDWFIDNRALEVLTLRADRRVFYHQAGETHKPVVVIMHGMLHTPELPTEVSQGLVDNGFRVISPCRAGYGYSSSPVDDDQIVEGSATDLIELLDHLKVKKFVAIGLMGGSMHAYAVAAMYPERVSRVINIAGIVPLIGDDDYRTMPSGMRAVVRTARFFPKLLPFLIRTTVALIDSGGVDTLMRVFYKNSPVDTQLCQQSHIRALFSACYSYTMHQGYATYTNEARVAAQNFSPYVRRINCPVALIHGELDRVVSISSVRKLSDAHPSFSVSEIPGCGQLALYAKPQSVFASTLAVLHSDVD